jgi:hypothetical protein
MYKNGYNIVLVVLLTLNWEFFVFYVALCGSTSHQEPSRKEKPEDWQKLLFLSNFVFIIVFLLLWNRSNYRTNSTEYPFRYTY